VILTTSYLAEAFGETVERATGRGMAVQVTHEEVALGTAGAIKNAESAIGSGTFLVFNGDVLTDVDLDEVIAFHRNNEALATIVLTPVDDPSAFGVVPTNDSGRVTGFIEKPARAEAPTNLINAGIYVLEPSVLERIPAGKEWSLERALFPELVADGAPLYALATTAYWMDVGTPDKYRQANIDTIRERFKAREGAAVADGVVLDPKAEIADSCLGTGTTVEEGATVVESVLLPGCRVGAGARVERSILGQGVTVGTDVALLDSTIGDDERLDA
jgi:mannose-1-phosphate guanylyltransferase